MWIYWAKKILEDEANSFAAYFLLPKAFEEDCTSIVKVSNPDAYIDIKQKWEVSLQAIAMKVYKLGPMEYQQYRYFFMSINKKGYKTIEPLDNEIVISRPGKIKSLFQLLFEKGVSSVPRLQEFFDRYYPKEQKVFTISELALKRS